MGLLGTPHHHIALLLSDSVAANGKESLEPKKKKKKKSGGETRSAHSPTAVGHFCKRRPLSFALVTPVEQELTK